MRRKERLRFILFVLACLALSAALSLYALKDNISYFRSPSDLRLLQGENAAAAAPGHVFRLGGLVKEGSVRRDAEEVAVSFVVTDLKNDVAVVYRGILPDLFREGQGVIATGALDHKGVFIADKLLAKHDENYMPPEVAKALEHAQAGESAPAP
jgi:cytochrome c-type biogenesis protein CcmE